MALSHEQIKELKSQLLSQIKDLPPEKRKEAQSQIDSLSSEALEAMLEEQQSNHKKNVFRMISDGEIPSVKISENAKAIAVLSTKSLSKGHTLILLKNPVENEASIPKEAHSLSEQLSKKLISSLNAKSTSIIPERIFGEIIINVIPIYDHPISLKSKREDLTIEDLEKLKTSINVEKIEKKLETINIEKKKSPEQNSPLKLKRRIP